MTFVVILFLFVGQKPELRLQNQELLMDLTWDMLDDSRLERRLMSGLTTTLQLNTEIKQGSEKLESSVLILLRYELWEEKLLIVQIGPELTAQRWQITHPKQLNTWFQAHPILLARLKSTTPKHSIKVRARLLPFSESEGEQAKEWFSKVIQVPDATSRTQPNPTPGSSGISSQTANPVFEVIMSRGLEQEALAEFHWKWTLP